MRHKRGTGPAVGGLGLIGLMAVVLAGAWHGITPGRAQTPPTVQVADGGDLGPILADKDGFTLYVFDRDEPGVSNCNDACAQTWPPLVLDQGDPVAPDGLTGTLSAITRADGGRQVAYNDRPLYRFAGDRQPGDTNGEGVGGIWHAARVAPPTVQTADGGTLGIILTGTNGMTLYTFDRDAPGTSNCNDACAQTWPPLTLGAGSPVAPAGLPGTLSLIERADDSFQVAYNDQPLYFFSGDSKPGDMNGDGIAGVWHVARVAGAQPAATATAAATPSPTPSPTASPTSPPPPPPSPTQMPMPYPPPGYPYP